MNDNDGSRYSYVADLKDQRGLICADDHRKPVTKIPCSDWVPVGVKDRGLIESMLEA